MAMAVDQIIVGIRAVSKLNIFFKLVYCKARPLGWAQHYEYYKPPNYNQFHTYPPPQHIHLNIGHNLGPRFVGTLYINQSDRPRYFVLGLSSLPFTQSGSTLPTKCSF